MTNKNFTVPEIISFIQKINCMEYEKFFKMYEDVFGYVTKSYVQEKYNNAMSNIGYWICSIDYNSLEQMMCYCLKK
jgi:hypothetical protein